MANRSYLYSTDSAAYENVRPEENYYDSRHVIPFSWFFFYRVQDIAMINVTSDGSTWQEVKLAREKDMALQAFTHTQPLLSRLVGTRIGNRSIADFIDTIRCWGGRYLWMDPEEVLGAMSQDDKWHTSRFARILELIGAEDARARAILDEVRPYVGAFEDEDDPDKYLGQVLGCKRPPVP